MQNVSVVRENGLFVDDEVLAEKLIDLRLDAKIEYKDLHVKLLNVDIQDDRKYLFVEISEIPAGDIDPLMHGNIDKQERHNISGSMNFPAIRERGIQNDS